MAVTFDNIGNGKNVNINTNGYTNFLSQLNKTDEGMKEVFKTYSDIADNNYANQVKQKTGNIMGALQSGQLASLDGIDLSNTDATALADFMEKKEATDAAELHQSNMLRATTEGNVAAAGYAEAARIRDEEAAKVKAETTEAIRKAQLPVTAAEIATANMKTSTGQFELDVKTKQREYAKKASEIARLSYDDQQAYLNNSETNAEEVMAVRALWRKNPTAYGEANNNNNYSVENQGIVDKFGKADVPTLADEKTYSALSKGIMSSDSKISKKSLNTAKEVVPDIDKVIPSYELYDAIGALASKLGYEPSVLQNIAVQAKQVGSFYGNIVGKNTLEKTNNDNQIALLAQMVDSLPENSPDRIQAEELLYEAKETSLALSKGRGTISAAQINRRLKKKQYGLSTTTRNTRDNKKRNNLDDALKLIKNSKLTPEEVAKALTK